MGLSTPIFNLSEHIFVIETMKMLANADKY